MNADFVDSNVILYLLDDSDDRKREAANTLIRDGLQEGTVSISFQVVQEVLNVVTRKFARPSTPEQTRAILNNILMPLWRAMPSQALYQHALEIQDRYRYSFYDSLVIAAALESGCTRLFSEDLQAGQRIEHLTIENPFAG